MKILYLIPSVESGAYMRTLRMLLQNVSRDSYAIAGVAFAEGQDAGLLGRTPVFPLDGSSQNLRALVDRLRPDIVHAFGFDCAGIASSAGIYSRCRVLLTLDDAADTGFLRFFTEKLRRRRESMVVCDEQYEREFLVEKMGFAPESVIVIPHAMEEQEYGFSPAKRLRVRFLADMENSFLVYTHCPDRAVSAVARSVAGASGLFAARPDIASIITCGEPSEGRIYRLVDSSGLHARVRVISGDRDFQAWFSGADLYIHAAVADGDGLLLRAMFAGRPCLAPASAMRDYQFLRANENVVLFDPENPADMFAKVFALAADASACAALGSAAHAAAVAAGGTKAVAIRYEAAYDTVLSQKPVP